MVRQSIAKGKSKLVQAINMEGKVITLTYAPEHSPFGESRNVAASHVRNDFTTFMKS